MSRCKGPGCGVRWDCDMQHGLVDGRCAECLLMAQAASNLNREQIQAVRETVRRASDGDKARVRIELDRPVRDSKVFIDDEDISRICQAVDVHAEIGQPARVTLHMIPHFVEITGFGDVYRHYGRVES